MSQRELAEYLHITDKAISKWERGVSQTKGY
ncbi:MAG: helix-turn-helix domain-containing protein [Blautia producta]